MTLLISILALAVIPLIYAIWLMNRNRHRKQKLTKLAKAYDRLLLQHQLSPERYEVIGNSVIGLDCKSKRFAVVDLREREVRQYCISLRSVCDAKIVESRTTNATIKKIELQLMQEGSDVICTVCFFDAGQDPIVELPHLARQADYWKNQIDIQKRLSIIPVKQRNLL